MSPQKTDFYPKALETRELSRLLPIYREFLDYAITEAINDGMAGALEYDSVNDELIYHIRLSDFERSLFAVASDIEEIWVIQKAGAES